MNLLRQERLAAFGAHQDRVEILAAQIVCVEQRPASLPGHIDITPVHDRHEDRVEVEPLRGQAILETTRPLPVGHFDEDELVDEFLQAAGEDRPGDTEALLKILEAPDAQEAIPQDQ
jgi:hypothetical protein